MHRRIRVKLRSAGFTPQKLSPATMVAGVRKNSALQSLCGLKSALLRLGCIRLHPFRFECSLLSCIPNAALQRLPAQLETWNQSHNGSKGEASGRRPSRLRRTDVRSFMVG